MVTAPLLSRGSATDNNRAPTRVDVIQRWLAHQRAAPVRHVAGTALQIVDEARLRPMTLEGREAPLVVQERFSLWLVGQLGGPAHLRVFPEEQTAIAKAGELGAEMHVPVLVIGAGGELADRVDPPEATVATPALQFEAEAGIAAKGATLEARPAPALKVARHADGWGVFLEGRVVATAPTRERARQRARALKTDPDFNAIARPVE